MKLQPNKIYCGDCMDYLPNIPGDAFLISDPPYNQKYHYGTYKDNLRMDKYKELLINVFSGRKSVIVSYPEETINLFGGGGMGICTQSVCWVYPSNTAKQSRLITWWNCTPDMRKVGQPYKNPTDKRIKKRIDEGKSARLYDWWLINQVKNVSKKENSHPCPMPLEVMKNIILLTTNEGDLVVDPFAGSGTTLLAAKLTNRNYIGIEMDNNYCILADKIIKEAK